MSQDCFYRPLTKEQIENVHNHNFDHPGIFGVFKYCHLSGSLDALDFGLMVETLRKLVEDGSVVYPDYDFKLHNRCACLLSYISAF